MTAIAWLFAIGSGVADGRYRILSKRSGLPPLVFIFVSSTLATLGFGIQLTRLPRTTLHWTYWPLALVIGPLLAWAVTLMVKAGRVSQLSVVGVYTNLTPSFMLVNSTVAYLVGLKIPGAGLPTALGVIGIILTTVGIYVLSVESNGNGWCAPLERAWSDPGARMMLKVAVIFSFTALMFGAGIAASSDVLWIATAQAGLAFWPAVVLIAWPEWREGCTLAQVVRHWPNLFASALCMFLGDNCYAASFKRGHSSTLSIVGKRLGTTTYTTLTTMLMGWRRVTGFETEHHHARWRLAGAALTLIGMTAVVIWGK